MQGGSSPGEIPRSTVLESGGLRLHLFRPAPELDPYITMYYRTEVPGAEPVEDYLPPEWANLRVGRGEVYEAAIGSDPMGRVPLAVLSGPTSRVTRLRIGGRYDSWGVGLLPLGFAAFVGPPACVCADRFEDMALHPKLAPLRALLESLIEAPDAMAPKVAKLDSAFTAMLTRPLPEAERIVATHRALLSGDDPSVAAVAARVGISPRTLERLCLRHFGFTPQLLLRRQRFLRSLAKFMVDPSMKWIVSLDTHYHDQAHFVRDFKRFLGMKPSEYAAMRHPIAMTAARARHDALGVAMQILHAPPRATAA